jgi:hypothetical protein
LERSEEKQLVLPDWPTNGSAKGVLNDDRSRNAGAALPRRAGSENAVVQNVINRTMEIVRSTTGDDVDNRTARATIFR